VSCQDVTGQVEVGLYRTELQRSWTSSLELYGQPDLSAISDSRWRRYHLVFLETVVFTLLQSRTKLPKTILKIAIKSTRKANINTIQTLDHDFVILVKIIFRNF